MTDEHDKEEIVRLDQYESLSDTTRWRPSPEIEDECLDLLDDVMPLSMRPTELQVEKFYEKGYDLYKAGQYKNAKPYFHMLTVLNPKQSKYMMALAACFHMLKEYEEAVDLYAMAAMFDDQNPFPQYYLAGCMLKLDQHFGALIALDMGIKRCENKPGFKALHDRMKMMRESVHKELLQKKEQGFEEYFHPEEETAPKEENPENKDPSKKEPSKNNPT